MAEETCQRYDGNCIHSKYDSGTEPGRLCPDANGNKHQQQVDVARKDDGFSSEPKA
jgi:hypothetical protein